MTLRWIFFRVTVALLASSCSMAQNLGKDELPSAPSATLEQQNQAKKRLIYYRKITGSSWLLLTCRCQLWMGLNWLLFTSTSMVNSVPRYTLILFPIFVLFAVFTAARPAWLRALTFLSLMFMTLFISLFVQGAWAY